MMDGGVWTDTPEHISSSMLCIFIDHDMFMVMMILDVSYG